MMISLELPVDLQSELDVEAARLGLALPDYLIRLVSVGRRAGAKQSGSVPGSGAELVRLWQDEGIIGSRDDISDPELHSRRLRERAERRLRG